MIKYFIYKFKKNTEIFGLVILIFITAISTSYFNYKKNLNERANNSFVDNIYFKKTLSHIFNNLEPKYKKIKHKIKSGETFDKILESYSIEKSEIIKIKNSLNKKVNLNKLDTKQIIHFSMYKTNNKIGVGVTSYSSDEISKIKGIKSNNIKDRLGYISRGEVIHIDNMVLIK